MAARRKTSGSAWHVVRRAATLIPAVLVFSTLAACGGGGGGGAKTVASAVRQVQNAPEAAEQSPTAVEAVEMAAEAAGVGNTENTGNTAQSGQATETSDDTVPEALTVVTEILESVSTGNTQPAVDRQPATTAPQTAPSGFDFTTRGTPSTQAAALEALGTAYNPLHLRAYGSEFGELTPSALAVEIAAQDSFQASADTRAHEAWAQGWTGRGVKVGVLDDFQTPDEDIPAITHGDLVDIVARQVAPEADIGREQLTFDCRTDSTDLWTPGQEQYDEASAGYDSFEESGYHIVNNSFGAGRYYDGSCRGDARLRTDDEWKRLYTVAANQSIVLRAADSPDNSPIPGLLYDQNMLFVYAAGNHGRECREGLAGCDMTAAALKLIREAHKNTPARATGTPPGGRMLFVGALEDDSNNMASYSLTAGEDMKYDFMVAHDDVDSLGDQEGTSFAAPRVTGAAALVRHKFPNLDGAALKQVLLQTADDLGAPGVDNVFGYGKLNILNALSPVGRVTSR